MTLKQHRRNIIQKISMRSKNMDWDYAIDLALEWNATDEKFMFLQELGLWSDANHVGVDLWINRVEAHLERVLADICGEPYTLK